MHFICVSLDTGAYIGNCTLSHRQYDPCGTEHMFDGISYVLQSTHIDQDKGVMYFTLKK